MPSSSLKVINPRCTCCRVMVVILCVCIYLAVATKSATYLIYNIVMSKIKCHGVLHGVFNVFVVWLLLKMFRSRVLLSFTNHHCLHHFLTSSQWTKEMAMASFQCDEYIQFKRLLLQHNWLITDHSTLADKFLGYLRVSSSADLAHVVLLRIT